MGRVIVRRNEFPRIIRDLPREVDKGVDDTARKMAGVLAERVWYRYGYIRQATVARVAGENHAEVWCGFNRGKGFYSRFQEWGTIYQAPRPIVGPTAHEYEPIYAQNMTEAVRKACGGR